jgi:hypothetical protein
MAKGPAENVFVATPAEAARGFVDVPNDLIGSKLNNIDVDGIHALHCVILGYSDDLMRPEHKEVYAWTDSNGPWANECPEEFVASLAEIQPGEYRRIGLRWWERLWEGDEETVRTEMIAQAPADSLACEVGVLADLARSAIRQGKKLYWVAPGC